VKLRLNVMTKGKATRPGTCSCIYDRLLTSVPFQECQGLGTLTQSRGISQFCHRWHLVPCQILIQARPVSWGPRRGLLAFSFRKPRYP
jgi:hypothetical protein